MVKCTTSSEPNLRAHLHPQLGVQVGQRLVHQEHRGLAHDRPAHRDPLALAARQLSRLAVQPVVQAQDLGRLLDPGGDVALRQLAHLEREADVLAHRHVRVERVVLEHHRDVPVLRREVVDRPPADAQRARGDVLQPGDHPKRRGLAAPRRADEHHELPVAHLEVQVPDGMEAVRVHLVDLVQLYRGHRVFRVAPPVHAAVCP
jgi:hypothetical protein